MERILHPADAEPVVLEGDGHMRLLHSQLLRYLDEVARAGSIRKASEKLNISSSSINRQILALEDELGSPIFHRLHRQLRLTQTGEILIDHVRRTLKDLNRPPDRSRT